MSLARHLGRLATLAAVPACVGAQQPAAAAGRELPRAHAPKPTSAAITEQDLMTRLYIFADDSMQGRATGTDGYRKGTDYIAAELGRLGLQPAGENGTYFQALPSRTIAAATRLAVGDAGLALWTDFVPLVGSGSPRAYEGAGVVFGGDLAAYAANATTPPPLTAAQVAGKVVAIRAAAGAPTSARALGALARGPLAGAAAIAVLLAEPLSAPALAQARRASMGGTTEGEVPYVLLVAPSAAPRLLGADPATLQAGATGPTLRGAIALERGGDGTARNVVAVYPGSDPRLKGQYVALGAHADHVGFSTRPVDHDSLKVFNARSWQLRGANNDPKPLTPDLRAQVSVNVDSLRRLRPARLDSISNGADDDGSGSMALLEIAEAFANGAPKPKRSVLFVWHVGEELGMLGSAYYSDHPTVPRDSIVAQINIDMIGRGGAADLANGGPGYVGVVGSRRLSRQLGDLVEEVSRSKGYNLKFDYGLDANGHPQNIYCRSDHRSYARYGIPIAFFFTGLHGDYHQVTDEPQYIDYANYTRLTSYIRDLTLAIAERPTGFTLDAPKPTDPNAPCRQ